MVEFTVAVGYVVDDVEAAEEPSHRYLYPTSGDLIVVEDLALLKAVYSTFHRGF